MSQRRSHSTKENRNSLNSNGNGAPHNDDHDHDHDHSHTHSHSIFGHTHAPGEPGHTKDPEKIIAALRGQGDRGSQITLVGLFSNVALTGAKGLAGWYMHSASLLADAGHSMSDLLGDFVTLYCWRFSKKPPSLKYPYGFAKFETVGTTTISLLLIGGAIGIGFHSYHLLIATLAEAVTTMPPGPAYEILHYITSSAPLPEIGHSHVHSVDPNAAWFALVSVVVKEWLYRITKVVADDEKSPVLLANAIHHRSDAYSSLVAFFAILGTWMFPAFPLDPVGGLIVSGVILQQGYALLRGAWGDLTDAGVSLRTCRSLQKILDPLQINQLIPTSSDTLGFISLEQLRARRAGSQLYVDLTVNVPSTFTVLQTSTLEEKISQTLKNARKEIAEVRVKFEPTE
ncbi:mitochondrial iron ion transporter [Cyathus striatus]|nr:mitochondrial iron ion transporter [Cyathus striatus]